MTRSLLALVLLLSPLARASCLLTQRYVADIAVESCETADAFAARRDACDLPWMTYMRDRMLEKHRGGVVLTGFVIAKTEITWWDGKTARAGERSFVSEPGTWFVEAEAKLSCEKTMPGDVVRLFLVTPCCDVFPPHDVPCWYDIGKLDTLWGPLDRAAGAR